MYSKLLSTHDHMEPSHQEAAAAAARRVSRAERHLEQYVRHVRVRTVCVALPITRGRRQRPLARCVRQEAAGVRGAIQARREQAPGAGRHRSAQGKLCCAAGRDALAAGRPAQPPCTHPVAPCAAAAPDGERQCGLPHTHHGAMGAAVGCGLRPAAGRLCMCMLAGHCFVPKGPSLQRRSAGWTGAHPACPTVAGEDRAFLGLALGC